MANRRKTRPLTNRPFENLQEMMGAGESTLNPKVRRRQAADQAAQAQAEAHAAANADRPLGYGSDGPEFTPGSVVRDDSVVRSSVPLPAQPYGPPLPSQRTRFPRGQIMGIRPGDIVHDTFPENIADDIVEQVSDNVPAANKTIQAVDNSKAMVGKILKSKAGKRTIAVTAGALVLGGAGRLGMGIKNYDEKKKRHSSARDGLPVRSSAPGQFSTFGQGARYYQ